MNVCAVQRDSYSSMIQGKVYQSLFTKEAFSFCCQRVSVNQRVVAGSFFNPTKLLPLSKSNYRRKSAIIVI